MSVAQTLTDTQHHTAIECALTLSCSLSHSLTSLTRRKGEASLEMREQSTSTHTGAPKGFFRACERPPSNKNITLHRAGWEVTPLSCSCAHAHTRPIDMQSHPTIFTPFPNSHTSRTHTHTHTHTHSSPSDATSKVCSEKCPRIERRDRVGSDERVQQRNATVCVCVNARG